MRRNLLCVFAVINFITQRALCRRAFAFDGLLEGRLHCPHGELLRSMVELYKLFVSTQDASDGEKMTT